MKEIECKSVAKPVFGIESEEHLANRAHNVKKNCDFEIVHDTGQATNSI